MILDIGEMSAWTVETTNLSVDGAAKLTLRHMRGGRTARPQMSAAYPVPDEDREALGAWSAGVSPGDVLRISWLDGAGTYLTGQSATARPAAGAAPDPSADPGPRATGTRARGGFEHGDPPEPIAERAERLGGAATSGQEVGVNPTVVLLSALVQDSNGAMVEALRASHTGPTTALATVQTAQLQAAEHVRTMDERLMAMLEKQSTALVDMARTQQPAATTDPALWERLFALQASKAEAERDAAILANVEDESPLKHAVEAIDLITKLAALKDGSGAPPGAVWDGVLANLANGQGVDVMAASVAKLTPEQRLQLGAQLASMLS